MRVFLNISAFIIEVQATEDPMAASAVSLTWSTSRTDLIALARINKIEPINAPRVESLIAVRAALHLLPAPGSESMLRQDRARARATLLVLLRGAGLVSTDEKTVDNSDVDMPELVDAAYRFLATSPGRLLMVHLEDVLGVIEQVNLPGTIDQHPNWRRKLPMAWEKLATSTRLCSFAEMLARLRPQ
jgi:4-alpha-glucanotransferase